MQIRAPQPPAPIPQMQLDWHSLAKNKTLATSEADTELDRQKCSIHIQNSIHCSPCIVHDRTGGHRRAQTSPNTPVLYRRPDYTSKQKQNSSVATMHWMGSMPNRTSEIPAGRPPEPPPSRRQVARTVTFSKGGFSKDQFCRGA